MSDLQERLDRAERAMTRAGFTLLEGAQEWKPPIGPSASPLLDRIDQLMTLLSDGCDINKALGFIIDRSDNEGKAEALSILSEHLDKCEAALAGKLPERPDTEWTDAASTPTAEDYRELQAQHDQLQSRLKAALDVVRELVDLPYSTGGLIDRLRVRERASDLLAEQASDHTEQPLAIVPKGWQLVPVEPTEEILRAIRSMVLVESCYRAMLAAAPKPEGAA